MTTTRLLFLALALAALVPPTATAGELCGDADASGAITVTDGVQTLRAAAALGSTCTNARCDVDGSGGVTVTDGVNVLRAAVGISLSLACPGSPATCETAVVTVALTVPEPIGAATLVLDYRANEVSLPGTGDAAAARVTILDPSALFGGGQPNDFEDRVEFSLVALDGVGAGEILTIGFDCLGATPSPAAFGCTLSFVYAPDGATEIEGATCSVTVVGD